jgi:surface antigen
MVRTWLGAARNATLAGALMLGACASTGGGYGGGGTQLSQCTRNALIGAGIGAIVGAAQDSSDNRAENAALGAAVGGLATYGVCRVLTAREQQRVENAYYRSLQSGQGVNESWQSDQGAPRNLTVQAPQSAPGNPNCRRINASINDGGSSQQLPAETFCRQADGSWAPA